MQTEKAFRLSEFLFGIAGWFSRSHKRSPLDATTMVGPLAMIGSRAPISPSQGSAQPTRLAAPTSPAPAIPLTASSIIVVPLPSGLGWSNDAIGRNIDDDEIEADALADGEDDDLSDRLVACLARPATTSIENAPATIVGAPDVADLIRAEALTPPSDDEAERLAARQITRAPLMLARQLRGVSRLNQPATRRQQGKKLPEPRAKAKAAMTAAAQNGRRSRPVPRKGRRAAELRGPVKATVPQAWILSRSARR